MTQSNATRVRSSLESDRLKIGETVGNWRPLIYWCQTRKRLQSAGHHRAARRDRGQLLAAASRHRANTRCRDSLFAGGKRNESWQFVSQPLERELFRQRFTKVSHCRFGTDCSCWCLRSTANSATKSARCTATFYPLFQTSFLPNSSSFFGSDKNRRRRGFARSEQRVPRSLRQTQSLSLSLSRERDALSLSL